MNEQLYSQGKYERATQLGEPTAEVRKHFLGAEHADTFFFLFMIYVYVQPFE